MDVPCLRLSKSVKYGDNNSYNHEILNAITFMDIVMLTLRTCFARRKLPNTTDNVRTNSEQSTVLVF